MGRFQIMADFLVHRRYNEGIWIMYGDVWNQKRQGSSMDMYGSFLLWYLSECHINFNVLGRLKTLDYEGDLYPLRVNGGRSLYRANY